MLDFYILGDMGSGEISQYLVANALNSHIKDKNTFICGLGDNIYEHGCSSINDPQFIEKFEKPYQYISNKIKFYMCIGNHDYGTYCGKGNSINQVKYGRKSQKNGGKWIMPDYYYTFSKKKGDVKIDFFVVDTNTDNLSDRELRKQFNYMSKQMEKSNADWKIVYGHHTWRSIAGHGNADKRLEKFLKELYYANQFDLYMCGHDHNKQIIEMKMNNDKILPLIVCGTGGKVYNDVNNFKRLDRKSKLKYYSNRLGYGNIRASKNKLKINFLDETNKIEKTYEIKKNISNSINMVKRGRTKATRTKGRRTRGRTRINSKTKTRSRPRSRSKSRTRSRSRSRSKSRSRSRSRSMSKSRSRSRTRSRRMSGGFGHTTGTGSCSR